MKRKLVNGTVTALERNPLRIPKLNSNISALGLSDIVTVMHYDGVHACDEGSTTPPYPAGTFDVILLDAPCTGLGQRPRFSMEIKSQELFSASLYQRSLMRVGIKLLKKGGYLCYSTCSISPLENEENVSIEVMPSQPDCVVTGPGRTRTSSCRTQVGSPWPGYAWIWSQACPEVRTRTDGLG